MGRKPPPAPSKKREILADTALVSQLVFQNALEKIVIFNLDGKIISANKTATALTGYSHEALISSDVVFGNLVHPEDKENLVAAWQQARTGENVIGCEYRIVCKDGQTRWFVSDWSSLKNDAGGVIGILEIAKEISERKTYESTLLASEQLFRRLAEFSSGILFHIDIRPQFRFSFVTPIVEQITGYKPETFYENPDFWFELVVDEDKVFHKNLFTSPSTTPTETIEVRLRHKDNRRIWIEERFAFFTDEHGQLEFVECLAIDITERKRLQEELENYRRGQAIGKLAGGVAHDFNNLLTAIRGYAELANSNAQTFPYLQADLQQIITAADRAANLTRQLLAFGRKQMLKPMVIDLNAAIDTQFPILERLVGEAVTLRFTPQDNLPLIKIDPGQIEQILITLAANARDALPEGGVITIETSKVMLEQIVNYKRANMKPGSYVVIAFSDNGVGMPEEISQHIFEPFLAAQSFSQNTGLGLASVYGIVKQSGGYIWVYSVPGQGTTFKIYFPCYEATVPDELENRNILSITGTETIFVVEDQESIRNLTQRILSEHGYKVTSAKDGIQALMTLQAWEAPLDLLITDVVMPKLGGRMLGRHIRRLFPNTTILFMSGYAKEFITQTDILSEKSYFMQKPFSPHELLKMVREILDSKQAQ